jgi:hypothetical protein
MVKLLSRNEFKQAVFARDQQRCIFCDLPAVDAHHIIERRLWSDGGYYLENGASVCSQHHRQCETTEISVAQIYQACGITERLLPAHLYSDQAYDKWANPILSNGKRLRGELFYQENVQKVLAQARPLAHFLPWVQYPKHLNLSLNAAQILLKEQAVVAQASWQQEVISVYNNYCHAHNVEHALDAQVYLGSAAASIQQDLPAAWRICGIMQAEQFYVLTIWNEHNTCLSWADTQIWAALLGLRLWLVVAETHNLTTLSLEQASPYFIRPSAALSMLDFVQQTTYLSL